MAVNRVDPYLGFNFTAEVDGVVVAGFNEVSGLAFETEVETFREGGVNAQEQQLPGPTKVPSRLILKRGLSNASALWLWYQKAMQGRIERKNVVVHLMDSVGRARWRWSFQGACPVKWTGPALKASTAEVAFETIEMVHRGLTSDSGLAPEQ